MTSATDSPGNAADKPRAGHNDAPDRASARVVRASWCRSLGVVFWGMFGAVLVIAFARAMTTGNPTQRAGRLLKIMREGLPGGEAVDEFDKAYVGVSGNDQHGAYDGDVAASFYSLASDLYEYGWGDSFHFGYRHYSEGHGVAISNSQDHLAMKLHVNDMDRVADFGCGIGGPLRGVVARTGANVTGITINPHQVNRARQITSKMTPYFQERSHYMVQDYLNVQDLEPNSFDAVFYMESSLHTEARTQTFSQAFKVLKPGGRLVAFEYVLLPGWDPSNADHKELMRMHLHGNGAAKTPTIEEDLAMVRAAGFEIVEHYDLMGVGDDMYGNEVFPWWGDLQMNWRFHLLPAHPWVRRPLSTLLNGLAAVGLVPADVAKAAHLMNVGGDGLSGLGKVGAITPQYVVVGRKPASAAA